MPVNSSRDRGQPIRPAGRDRSTNKAAAKTQLKQIVVAEVAERIDKKLNKEVIKGQEKVARKTAHHLDNLDRLTSHLEALDVWTRAEPGSRRPRFTRETIAQTAIQIADSEGFDAVSMRRIAAELDAGTMTLYHYVRTKDELLALVTDTLMAELVIPLGSMPADWRAALTAIAHRSRAMLEGHPWILDITDDPSIGPNSVRHFDQSLQSVSSLDVPLGDKLDLMMIVDEYVFGYCLHQRKNLESDDHAGVSDELVDYVDDLSATGDYPELRKLIDEHGKQDSWGKITARANDPSRFDRNLARILDGFEADFARRPGSGS
ncbi:MAG: Transcriptional regulator, TetR family protein [Acidimicrobiales bacterium]|nr:Transcriptional regulator, TetR family protein [Acidimicrobiales bacterium]